MVTVEVSNHSPSANQHSEIYRFLRPGPGHACGLEREGSMLTLKWWMAFTSCFYSLYFLKLLYFMFAYLILSGATEGTEGSGAV